MYDGVSLSNERVVLFRDFNDGFVQIRFAVWFKTFYLKSIKVLRYKYMVYSAGVASAYEFLHGHTVITNRCLEVSANKCVSQGI